MMIAAAASRLDNFLQLLGALAIFIFVLAITYFVTSWIGNYQKVQMQSRNIQVIETLRLTNNKFIQIIKIAEEYFVISISKDHVEFMTKLDPENAKKLRMPENKPGEGFQESFQEILKKIGKNKK